MSISDCVSDLPFSASDMMLADLMEHRQVFESVAAMIEGPFLQVLQLMEASVGAGGKILLFGNGGSAADAQHIAAELVVRYKANRLPIPAIALTTDTSVLTACGNDLGFEALFSRQIEALARAGDLAIGISTSGSSPNVVAGLREARRRGVSTVGLSGQGGGKMQDFCDAMIAVPSSITARIQEMHILIGHLLCKALERRLDLV